MKYKLEISSSVLSQAIIAAMSVMTVPVYIAYIGVDGYGFYAYIAYLQGWYTLLDMGVSTIAFREVAKSKDPYQSMLIKEFVRISFLYLIFVFIGVTLLFSSALSNELKIKLNSLNDNYNFFILLAGVYSLVFVRVITNFLRMIVMGSGKVVMANLGAVLFTFVRFCTALLGVYLANSPLQGFVLGVLVAAILEGLFYFKNSSPWIVLNHKFQKLPHEFFQLCKESIRIGLVGCVWVVTTQVDKFFVLNKGSVEQFATFTLAGMFPSFILLGSNSLSPVFLKLFTREGQDLNNRNVLYCKVTATIGMIFIPPVIFMLVCAHDLLFFWTRKNEIADAGYIVLQIYAVASLVLANIGMIYCLQQMKGIQTSHLISTVAYLIGLSILTYFLSQEYSMVGVSFAWLTTNIIYLLTWSRHCVEKDGRGLFIQPYIKFIAPFSTAMIGAASLAFYSCEYTTYNTPLLRMSIVLAVVLCMTMITYYCYFKRRYTL